jgi:FtsP/CotA-like multicopper oxidase with cupredoxin domain
LLDKPYSIPEILLTPSERADVLVKADQEAGSFRLLSLPYNRGCGSVPQTLTLMTLSYNGEAVDQSLPAVVNPMAARLNIDLSNVTVRGLFLSMGMGRGYINGMDFDIKPFTITSKVNTYEVWEISSQCMMDHVFHLHINHAQVLWVRGGYAPYSLYSEIPALKDSFYVPRGGTVAILVRIADYTGMTMFHCHIVEHEDIGMMGMWDITPSNETLPMTM